jgi:23S rRNA (guanosine2251-2'-O)-methyltransferase
MPTRKYKSSRGRRPPSERNKNTPGNKAAQSSWIYGWHTVRAALGNPARQPGRLVATAEAAARIVTEFPAVLPETASRATLDALLPKDAVHQGIALYVPPRSAITLDDILADPAANALVVILDQVTDPHNVGAVLRSAAAFGAAAVIVQDRGTPPETGVLAKAASGALDIVPLVRVTNLARTLEALGAEGFWRIGFDGEARDSIGASRPDGRIALVLGAEGSGLRRLTRQNCDQLARIATPGRLGSLNVSNAAAIALYEFTK